MIELKDDCYARRLEQQNAELLTACKRALEHTSELEDAFARGCIKETDGLGGERSNRNVEVNRILAAMLKEHPKPEGK